ncbi:hypothetical protein JNB63_11800 [Microbacterium trichothecenolyticum]|uniref:hypothetical protein n=1 Tax=Microbacterium trichothecenolyticum TaxID=69370 RepID=UPI001C6DF3A1|nr:hypothetical protein [Microbacterium trichothecenolyticum]MBW9120778.1 hypothetical protein [Microbacterium trichothecenolyticum]
MRSRPRLAWGRLYLVVLFGIALIGTPAVFVWNLVEAGGDLSTEVFYGSKWGTQSLAEVLPALVLMLPILVVAEVLAVRYFISETRRRPRAE